MFQNSYTSFDPLDVCCETQPYDRRFMTKISYPKTICVDFDGVLNSYESGWIEADFIPDPPVEGALEFIVSVLEDPDLLLQIYSSRSHQQGGIRAMQTWLKYWMIKKFGWEKGAAIGNQLKHVNNQLLTDHSNYYKYFPTVKPPAHIQIDDRAHCFTGTFPSLQEIKDFKPWNKK